MHVLVTGAAGFLGQAVLTGLRHHHRVTGTDVRVATAGVTFPADVAAIALDLTNWDEQWAQLPPDVDAVVHTAALIPDNYVDWRLADRLWRVNGLGTLHLLQWARANGVRRFINISSHSVYKNPHPFPTPESHHTYPNRAVPYALSKLAGETFTTNSRPELEAASLRLPTLYGPGMKPVGVLHHFFSQARTGQPIDITGAPNLMLDFLHVADAVQAIANALAAPALDSVYNIGAGVGRTLEDLARAAWMLFNPGHEPHLNLPAAVALPQHQLLDIQRARQDLGYVPAISLEAGLRTLLGND